jgi:hypothetical protein
MTDPRTGEVFTEDGAWEYVADKIDGGVDIHVIELSLPPGKKGYVISLPSHDTQIPIYVKLQLSADFVIGRSFHYSTLRGRGENDEK